MITRRGLTHAFLHVFTALIILEVMLRLLDPAGVVYYRDMQHLMARYEPDETVLFILPPGKYDLRQFDATMTEQGRRVPDSQPADCRIAAIGDSVTFGYGVEDSETWVNLLAREFPAVEFINAGIPNYNSLHVLRSMDRYPADGYLYLVSGNDMERGEFMAADDRYIDLIPQFILYIIWLRSGSGDSTPDPVPFLVDLAQIMEHDSVRLFAWEPEMETMLESHGYPVTLAAFGDETISAVDSHPNAAGHRMIAEQMLDQVMVLISEVCI